MRTRYLLLVVPWALYQPARAQQPYPDLTIQGEEWMSGTHYHAVAQGIRSPGSPTWPMSISHASDAEFISGIQVRLTDGFHAGNFNTGHFRAHIDPALGTPPDLVVITPDPATHLQSNVLHVEKWEKLELGLRLPQEYLDAIDRFFAHYYSNGTSQFATPGNVDAQHDLNPYADDSLQLVMTLADPQGQQRMKWGFFMREAKWASTSPNAILAEDPTDVLHPYSIRFRFAPDMEGEWALSLTLKAPHTNALNDVPLPNLHYTGYAFVCDPPLEDNRGPLHVNEVNRRTLQFEDGTSFFGLGTNMADKRSGGSGVNPYRLLRKDLDMMDSTMKDLHQVGGNFLRMFLLRNIFAPEYVNLGVYDAYRAVDPCATPSGMPTIVGNGQYHSWAFDHILDQARANKIYIQLCIDPYPPIIDYENFLWGQHPYVVSFLEPERDQQTGRYDVKKFFYTDGDPQNTESGVFYYWKRKYKYIMSRWGYSVNIPIIEPFNEVDQMLTYSERDLSPPVPSPPGYQPPAVCAENKILWPADPDMPWTVSQWMGDIADHVRLPVDTEHPATSPLGESTKLFLISYARNEPADISGYYLPFTNPKVDLIDAHMGLQQEWEMRTSFDQCQAHRENFQSTDAQDQSYKKPFHHGEITTFGSYRHETELGIFEYGSTWKIFDNYDISFHNELWASTFFGSFATGTCWAWERVFWWPNALDPPPFDDANPYYGLYPRTSILGGTNALKLGDSIIPTLIKNRKVHHHFKPLSDLLAKPNWQALDFLNGSFSAHRVYDDQGRIECYYLINEAQNTAIGWVHNLNAYWANKVYITKAENHFLDCVAPNTQVVALPGFQPSTDYYISYFPTRMNTEVCPDDGFDDSGSGTVTLDLSSEPLGDTLNNYIDTLHQDYAFIIAPFDMKSIPGDPKSMQVANGEEEEGTWDFVLFPNPADEEVFLRLPDDGPYKVEILDMMGRQARGAVKVAGRMQQLSIQGLARGVYEICVTSGRENRTKKLMIR